MKTLFSIATALLVINLSIGQSSIEKFVNTYENDQNFTVVDVSPKMFEMVGKIADGQEAEVKKLLQGIKSLKILTTDVNPGTVYADAKKKLDVSSYETLLTVRDKDQNVKFYSKEKGDVVNELLLLVGGNDEFALISLIGSLDLNKIKKLTEKVDWKKK